MNHSRLIFITTLSLLMPYAAQAGKSNLRAMLPYISSVKDQKGRNTCTIQTTIAMLETYSIKYTGQSDINLSEEWLQYLAAVTNQSGGAKGSMVQTDVTNALRWGVPSEQTLPYTYGEWKGSENTAKEMCETLKSGSALTYTRCLYGKFPASYLSASDTALQSLPKGDLFASARTEAKNSRAFFASLRPRSISSNAIKAQLDANKSVALEINLFHGSWNTAAATQKGMGRDKKLYAQGIVTYPEKGSLDRKLSPPMANRHAVQIVGYDDDIELTYKVTMEDGTVQTFKRKGVYIFKNSWGTRDFGRNFTYEKMRIRGFGMILQDHVHEFGKTTVFE